MKAAIMATLALAMTGFPAGQDADVEELIEKLGSDDFEVQGKAAKELERLGKAVLPTVQRLANDPAAKEQVRAWCRRIGQKIEAGEKRLKELVLKLAGEEVEARDAEDELQKFGRAAVPHLLEAMNSENPEVRKRAVRVLRALDAGTEIERAEKDAEFTEGEVKNGFRFKFRSSTPKQPAVSAAAVLSALKWLARHQNRDGSWGGRNFVDQCVGGKCRGGGDAEYDAGVTGLALLAFMGAGHSHLSQAEYPDPVTPGRTLKFGDVVKNGLKWLMAKQDPEGCVGFRGVKYMYNHLIATMALGEAYGMTGSTLIKGAAKKAVDFALEAQHRTLAWRYVKNPDDNDTSVTGWAIMALRTAEIAGVEPANRDAYRRALRWLDHVTNPEHKHRAGYNRPDSGKVFVPGRNDDFKHHEAMTAVNVFCRIFMGRDRSDPALTGTALLMDDLPVWRENYIDFYYWYTGSLALFHQDETGGAWKKWHEAARSALIPNQRTAKHGCAAGSWASDEDRWGFEGGQVYATALNALTLETHYRYPRK